MRLRTRDAYGGRSGELASREIIVRRGPQAEGIAMRSLFCFALVLGLGANWSAQAVDYSGAYYCVGEFAGGISYDATNKNWKGTVFRPSKKFVLRLKFVKSRVEKVGETVEIHWDDYFAFINVTGSKYPTFCGTVSSMDEYGFLTCSDYRLNLKQGRFLLAYLTGFINGRDEGGDTPSIEGGNCTKIE